MTSSPTKFHVTTQPTSSVRLSEILWYESGKVSQISRDDSGRSAIWDFTVRSSRSARYDSAKIAWYDSDELHGTTSPNCTIRLNLIARHSAAKFHERTSINSKMRLKQIPRHDTPKFHVTTPGHLMIRRIQKVVQRRMSGFEQSLALIFKQIH